MSESTLIPSGTFSLVFKELDFKPQEGSLEDQMKRNYRKGRVTTELRTIFGRCGWNNIPEEEVYKTLVRLFASSSGETPLLTLTLGGV